MGTWYKSSQILIVASIIASVAPTQASLFGRFTDIADYRGDVIMISAPRRVRSGATQGNLNAKLFLEQEDFVITEPIPVDTLGIPGIFDEVVDFQGGEIESGTINSYFLHVDSRPSPLFGYRSGPSRFQGSITFENPILGLIGFADTLLETRELQSSTTRYPLRRRYAHDLDPVIGSPVGDTVSISSDRRTLTFDFLNGYGVDQLRIVTSAVPEPAALSLLGIATICLVLPRLRRKVR